MMRLTARTSALVGLAGALSAAPAMAEFPFAMYGIVSPYPSFPAGSAMVPGMGMLGLGGGMYPAMEVVPNLVSFRHQNLTGNPYMGGPLAGNPYLRQAVSFGLLAVTPSPSVLPWMAGPMLSVPSARGPMPLSLPMGVSQPPGWLALAGVRGW